MSFEFTHSELGALLIAVGTEMHLRNLCAPAALDGNSDEALVETMKEIGISEETARKLLDVELTTAVDVIVDVVETNIEPEVQKTPAQLRAEGQPYCPKCYTFGHTHRSDCPYKLDGMSKHVENEK